MTVSIGGKTASDVDYSKYTFNPNSTPATIGGSGFSGYKNKNVSIGGDTPQSYLDNQISQFKKPPTIQEAPLEFEVPKQGNETPKQAIIKEAKANGFTKEEARQALDSYDRGEFEVPGFEREQNITNIPKVGEIKEEIKENKSGFDIGNTIGTGISTVGEFFKFESHVDDGIIESGAKFLANLPGNTVQLAGDLITIASDPVGTAGSIKTLSESMVETGLNKMFSSEVGQGIGRSLGMSEEKLELIKGEGYFTSEEKKIISGSVMEEMGRIANEPGGIKELLIENPTDVLLTFVGGLGVAKNIAKSKNLVGLVDKIELLEKVTNPINVLKAEGKIITLPVKGISKVKNKYFPKESLDDLVLKVSQTSNKKKDLPGFKKALSEIDTKGVKTYEELDNLFSEKIKTIAAKQDKLLPDEVIYRMEDLAQTSKGGTIKINYIEKALEDMNKFYTKTNQIDDLEKILQLQKKGKLSIKDINNIAREYNVSFGQKAFNKMGEAKFSDIGQGFEGIRKGVKETARGLLPDDTMKMLDSELSNLYNSRSLTDKMVKSVDNLTKKLTDRGIGYTITQGVIKLADTMTFGGVKGVRDYFITRGYGSKVNNSIDLQNNLPKILKEIDKINKIDSKISNKQFIKKVNELVKKLGTQVKEKGEQLTDDIADKVGARAKFTDNSGKTLDDFGNPESVELWIKSKFSNEGHYKDIPVIRRVDNTTLYQGGAGENRQFWTRNKKYAESFGRIQEKTGSFYQVDNGNRVVEAFVEVNK